MSTVCSGPLPPTRLVGLSRQCEQCLALRIGDSVESEEIDEIAFLEPDPAQLHPTDLGIGGADLVACGLAADPARLPPPAQLPTNGHAQDGGTTCSSIDEGVAVTTGPVSFPTDTRRARHRASMPQSYRGRDETRSGDDSRRPPRWREARLSG